MADTVIRGGTVIDGLGSPPRRADVAITAGRIEAIGTGLSGSVVVDADGLIVAPGFVDVHTHYDAQLIWDPAATPSVLHGVTTVLGGNCGFSIAPLDEAAAAYLVPMLARVEGMPEAALAAGCDFQWRSFAEYLARLDGTLAVNAGFLVGHSALRVAAMGSRAVGEPANAGDVATMVTLLHESVAAGALGFSTSRGQAHVDHNGDPVPSRHASLGELLALARATGEHPGTSIEAIPTLDQSFSENAQMFLVSLSLASQRPVNWNTIGLEQSDEARASRLAASDFAAAAGGKVVALARCEPDVERLSLENQILFESFPGWADTMRLPLPERVEAFRSAEVRSRLRDGAATITRRWTNWSEFVVLDVSAPELEHVVGRRIGDIARERGVDAFDALCDIVVADDLRTGLAAPDVATDDAGWRRRVELYRDPRVVLGGSDAGAHVDGITSFAMYTGFLAEAVRKRQLLPLEEAVALVTSVPAQLYGLVGRGYVVPGAHADLVVFDPDTVGHGAPERRADLPGGAVRMFSEPVGVEHVLVNGVVVARNGLLTGAAPGQTLRSGRDTVTPSLRGRS
jgi:N-acyl-D-aspartate/D-glutamate deacylase